MKESLFQEFVENNCSEMWKEIYFLDEATVSWIINDCFKRSAAILKAAEADDATELEIRFSNMVESWD